MMGQPNYTALCLGGPNAGQMMEHFSPTFEFAVTPGMTGLSSTYRPPSPQSKPLIGKRHYFFVPVIGHRGFWLFEEEVQGNHPMEDIMRLLGESYISHQQLKGKSS